MSFKDLQNLVQNLIPISKEMKDICLKKFENNGIETINDLLCLTDEDIENFSFPLLFKNKLLDELKKIKIKPTLSETEIKLIKSFFETDIPIENVLSLLDIKSNTAKADLVKEYYESLFKPLKPVPTKLKELFVNSKEIALPCYEYPSKQLLGKKYYTLLVMGETGSGKTTLLDVFVNYLAGINFEDEWRYKLVNENPIYNFAESHNNYIPPYFVNYHRNDGPEIN